MSKIYCLANQNKLDNGQRHIYIGYPGVCLQGTAHYGNKYRGLEALQSRLIDSYHTSVLCWPQPPIKVKDNPNPAQKALNPDSNPNPDSHITDSDPCVSP